MINPDLQDPIKQAADKLGLTPEQFVNIVLSEAIIKALRAREAS